jgi:hypothetical protein
LYIEEKEGLTGVTDMLTHKMNTRVLQVGEMFGNFSSIGQDSWKDLYVYAYEGQAEVISIDNS